MKGGTVVRDTLATKVNSGRVVGKESSCAVAPLALE